MTIKLGVGGLMARPLAEELFTASLSNQQKKVKKDVISLEKERKKSE